MIESIEEVVAIFVSLGVLWVIFGPLSNGGTHERGYRSDPEGAAAGRGNRPGRP
jgi:hypothetical protein